MADKRFEYVPFVTQVMTARHPKLTEPDTEGDYADGKYKTEATADDDYTEHFRGEIQAVIDQHFASKKKVYVPWKETKEGAIAFFFRSPKKQPELVDAKGNSLKQGIIICGGSLIRVAGVIVTWCTGGFRGVSLWLDAVRVIKLAPGFAAAFGPPEDGFDGTCRLASLSSVAKTGYVWAVTPGLTFCASPTISEVSPHLVFVVAIACLSGKREIRLDAVAEVMRRATVFEATDFLAIRVIGMLSGPSGLHDRWGAA
ncbi:hypothetical protein SAMN05216573_10520 [Bradyrhizobium sp. Rc3b]|nr:hypothetical protein [Bradyrhizobium sp. Rc3b]SFM85590.1 hypothetical protein SAMN05216573_10520 [Bradyrhizobium sp. Rc3b]